MGWRVEPLAIETRPARRRPRVNDEAHLRFVRKLPCAICGLRRCEAAHLRAGNRLVGKRGTGIGEKASDHWTIPLCRGPEGQGHHAEQHSMGEVEFWRSYGIDPWLLALAIFAASVREDIEAAETAIAEHRLCRMTGGNET